MTVMLYKFPGSKPGKHILHGLDVDYIVVAEDDVERLMDNEGWEKSPKLAKELHDDVISGKKFPEKKKKKLPTTKEGIIIPPVMLGDAFDKEGKPWNEKIHYQDKRTKKDGTWMLKPGIKKEVAEEIEHSSANAQEPESEEEPTEVEESTEIVRFPVESSNIKSVGYNVDSLEMEVEFSDGALYRYIEVPEEVYEEFLKAESIGKYFHVAIKGNYQFTKI